eukprot:TRINITY_DN108000_c0_g1_i1.p1 TRINITY_DN108000_c0_g1~~TRINITY_DN108000_c0_g1_i1.p1  ORF type:complete len:210 (+),score=35.90 TRINITY_DN108000_c0_g1_i1:53-631(+)
MGEADVAVDAKLPVGQVVLIRGLVSAPELNGSAGRVLSYEEEKGRYAIILPKDGSKKLLKLDNLQPLVADAEKARAIMEAAPTEALGKMCSLMQDGGIGFADLDDADLRCLCRNLIGAGYWAKSLDLMIDLMADLDLAEHPSAPEAMELIRSLETSDNLDASLTQIGNAVKADKGLAEVFDQLKARGHDFDF